jgi:L,D-transpeptidase ErfK/SrfK
LSPANMFIHIKLQEKRLYLYQRELLFNSYPIAIGKPSTPSPVGSWTIVNKKILDGRQVYGTRWMGLSKPNYGIHGTNNPHSIGKAVSLGCIRMYNHDVESIFSLVSLGTPVEISEI